MSFKDFQKEGRHQELKEERKAKLNEMSGAIHEATRSNIHGLLKLPGVIRGQLIDLDDNYRAMLKERLEKYLEMSSEQDGVDLENRPIVQRIIEGIKEIDLITDEMDLLGEDNESDPPEDPDPEPDSGSSPGVEPAVNAA